MILVLLVSETAYFFYSYLNLPSSIPSGDMVLIYSGPEDRTQVLRDWTGPAPTFFLSGEDYTPQKLERELKTGRKIIIEDRARTTDQNARYSAPLVRQAGMHQGVLALPWYHLPRALFLTRYYLMGSKITVMPYATIPLPKSWWRSRYFYLELGKFWGSLGRVGLAFLGWETGPDQKPKQIRN